jgi:hypothetical protein
MGEVDKYWTDICKKILEQGKDVEVAIENVSKKISPNNPEAMTIAISVFLEAYKTFRKINKKTAVDEIASGKGGDTLESQEFQRFTRENYSGDYYKKCKYCSHEAKKAFRICPSCGKKQGL